MATLESQEYRAEVVVPPPSAPGPGTEPAASRARADEKTEEVLAGGSLVEAIGGVAAVVLAIVGLGSLTQGLFPVYMGSIAAIALGVALVFEGGAIMARYQRLWVESGGEHRTTTELGGGMTVEVLGGLAGAVLGILALLGLLPVTLIAVAAVVFGCTLLLGSGATSRLNHLWLSHHGYHPTAQRISREAVLAASGAQVLVGLAGAVLGILALIGIYPLTLSLVALLCMGGSVLLSGAAVGGRMMAFLTH